jgi:hypothetical protein
MRYRVILVLVALLAFATPASTVTGTGQITVAIGSEMTTTLAANTAFVLVGWVPVVASLANASGGNIYAYVNGQGFPFAHVSGTGVSQDVNTLVGQYLVNTISGALDFIPAYQAHGGFVLTNNSASTRTVILGCGGNHMTGACFFNIRTVPTADPIF